MRAKNFRDFGNFLKSNIQITNKLQLKTTGKFHTTMRISSLFHFFLYWTSDILDPGDVSANTSSHSDANDQQIDDTGFELISYDTENLVFDDDDIDDEELLSFGIPPNALAVLPDEYYAAKGSVFMDADWYEPDFLAFDIPIDATSTASRYKYSAEKIEELYNSSWKDQFPELVF